MGARRVGGCNQVWEESMSGIYCISDYQRPGKTQATETKTTSINTIAESVWCKKTIHGESLKRIAREIGRTYTETEDLLVEAAMNYGNEMYRSGLRFGRTMHHGSRRSA
jgi:hypothetical protein